MNEGEGRNCSEPKGKRRKRRRKRRRARKGVSLATVRRRASLKTRMSKGWPKSTRMMTWSTN
jgi:hypothetical protein